MSLTLGRVGLSGEITLADARTVAVSGDTVRLAGIVSGTVADALHLRDQLQGLNDLEEVAVPVVFGGSFANMDGYYRIDNIEVGDEVGYHSIGYLPWTASLTRPLNYRTPTIEVDFVRALRANGHSITAGSLSTAPILAFPKGDYYRIGSQFAGADRSTADSATLRVHEGFTANGSISTIHSIAPSSHYLGACKLEESIDGTYRAVTGRQIVKSLTNWRLTNGLIRVTPNASNTGRLDVSHWDGSQWETAKTYRFESGVGGVYGSATFTSVDTAVSLQVLRNTPDLVSLRIFVTPPTSTAASVGANRYDLTIVRGMRRVEIGCPYGIMLDHARLGLVTGEASTAITGAIRATSNDASGNRMVLGGDYVTNTDLTNGKVSIAFVSSSRPNIFFISSEIGGSGASGYDTAQNEAYSFYCTGSSRQWVHGAEII